VEHPRRLRGQERRRRERAGRPGLPARAHHEARRRPGQVGREALQNFTSGTGDVLISYENEAITARKKGQKVDYVIPDQTILDREPDRGRLEVEHATQAKAFVAYALSPAASRSSPTGLPPGRRGGFLDKNKDKFPTSRAPLFIHPRSRRLEQGHDEFFDPDKVSVAKIEEAAGSPLPSEASAPLRCRPCRSAAPGPARARRSATLWLSLDRADPLRAPSSALDRRRLDASGAVTSRSGAALQADAVALVLRAAVNAVRARYRVGARARHSRG
jgi:hypothetical protein